MAHAWVVTPSALVVDRIEAATLFADAFADTDVEKETERAASCTGTLLVWDNGIVVGALTYTEVADEPGRVHLDTLATDLAHRRTGIASALVREFLGKTARGARRVTVAVEDGRLGEFYRRFGFSPTDETNRAGNAIWERRAGRACVVV